MDKSVGAAEQDALFQTVISTAVDGIIVIDARANILVFNKACERLFGYGQEVIGKNVKELMPEPFRANHDEYIARYRATREARIIGIGREVVGQRKGGTIFPMYLSVGEGKIDGETVYVGIIHDLTKEKAAEAKFKELQSELLHVSRLDEMGQMAAALAHELNQPLTAMTNYLKAARRTLAATTAPVAAKAQELIDKAAVQTLRAGEIIRHLREFIGKRETGRSQENIAKLVEEAVAFGSVGAADANVRVKLALDPAPEQVLIDKVQVQQVIVNLVRNAVEAMQSSKRRELSVTCARSGDFLEIAVIDTGPGLPPEVTGRLFQPFVTTKEKGMGIGLSICQSIVEGHGGRIWAEPNPDGGTAFRFRLPLLLDQERTE
ncbi:MAG: PAS domain-containing sensor histidine kinase [Alphaproteobacteria bacterium]